MLFLIIMFNVSLAVQFLQTVFSHLVNSKETQQVVMWYTSILKLKQGTGSAIGRHFASVHFKLFPNKHILSKNGF